MKNFVIGRKQITAKNFRVLRFQIDLHFADESNNYFSHDQRHVTAAFTTGGKLRHNLPKKALSSKTKRKLLL